MWEPLCAAVRDVWRVTWAWSLASMHTCRGVSHSLCSPLNRIWSRVVSASPHANTCSWQQHLQCQVQRVCSPLDGSGARSAGNTHVTDSLTVSQAERTKPCSWQQHLQYQVQSLCSPLDST